MEKKPGMISLEFSLIVLCVLIAARIYFFPYVFSALSLIISYFLQIILEGAAAVVIAMAVMRLITTKWGNFLKGWLIFLIIAALCQDLLFIRNFAVLAALFLVLSGAGVYLFFTNGILWDFSSRIVIFRFAAGLAALDPAKTGKMRIPYPAVIILTGLITLSCVYFYYLKERIILNAVFLILFLAAGGAFLTLLGMTVNRLLTARWGNFLRGWPVFQAAAGLYFYFFLNENDFIKVITFIILYIIAFIVFFLHGKTWVYSSPDNLPEKKEKPGASPYIMENIGAFLGGAVKKILDGLAPAVKSGYFKTAAAVILALLVLISALQIFNNYFSVSVKSYSPRNTAALKTGLRLTLTEEVSIKSNLVDYVNQGHSGLYSNVTEVSNVYFIKPKSGLFVIDPEIKGTWRFEDGNTFIFTPDAELDPSTEYKVIFNPEGLYKKGKVILGKSFSFSTLKFEVTGIRAFFTYDVENSLEKEIVGEINFNVPVDINELGKYVSMKINGLDVKFKLESSGIPTRYYIRSGDFRRRDNGQKVILKVSGGLNCEHGKKPLDRDYSEGLVLPEKEKLAVVEAKTWPVSGNTYIVLLFNRPVKADEIRRNVRITDEKDVKTPFTVETEYCYAILKADFSPEKTYEVTASKGMTSEEGLKLPNEFNYKLKIEDLNPDVSFSKSGNVLPSEGGMDIELSTINLDNFRVKIDKIYRNNIVYFLDHPSDSKFTKPLLYKTFAVEGGNLNEKVLHYINLKKFHDMEYKGLYRITLSDPRREDSEEGSSEEYQDNNKSKIVLCTDLGIIAKHSGPDLIVNIYSIIQLNPIGDVTVRLVSKNNQVIALKKTDASGQAVFENWKEGGNEKFYPELITAELGEDFSYLGFNSSRKDQSRFSIGGRLFSKTEMQAFITPERGVYRPGDKAYLSAVVRNGDLTQPASVSVNLEITDPTGGIFETIKKELPGNGLITFEVSFPSYSKTGSYNATLKIGSEMVIGTTVIKVEEFIPDKIDVKIKSEEKHTNSSEPLNFKVTGQQLFGPPASGNRVRTQVRLVSREFLSHEFQGYTFSDLERRYDSEFFDLGEDKLDDRGEREYSLKIPSSVMPPSALDAEINSEVFDEGGRAVNMMKTVPVDRYQVYFGIKPEVQEVYYIDRPIDISLAAADPDGRGVFVSNVNLFIKHRIYYSIFRQYGENDEYQSQYYDEPFLHKEISIGKIMNFKFLPKSPGYYFIYLGNDDSMRSSVEIYVQGPGLETMDETQPENINITLSRDKYDINETAVATVRSAIPGKLFFTVEREKVLYARTADLVDNKAVISFPVLPEYAPNAYVCAYVIRKPDPSLLKMPMSALGIKTLDIKPGNKKMEIEIGSQDKTSSLKGLDVKLKVKGSSPGCGVVLSAVDEGILQITQFKTPDPFSFFYEKRALETSLYSIFDSILPDIKAVKEAIGGDEINYKMSRRHINPVAARRVRSISLFSGILKPDENGMVSYHFNIPQFNGRLRVMAFSADGDKFGSASKYVTVSDPIVLSYSLPRIMAPGDSIELPVRVYNQTGVKAKIEVSLKLEGPVTARGSSVQTIVLPEAGQGEIFFDIRALNDAGKAVFRFEAKSGGIVSPSMAELAVRPPRALETVTHYGEIAPHGSASVAIPGNYYTFGRKIRFSASPGEITKFLGAMEYVLRYPYGCSEQTASSAFPLIYYKDLAEQSGYFTEQSASADYFIQEAVKKLEGMLLPSGEFSVWPGGTQFNHYNSLYISHFLFEADRHGYEVDRSVLNACEKLIGANAQTNSQRLDRRDAIDQDLDLTARDPYNLYLEALIGKPDRESMDYERLNKLKDMDYAGRCRLAEAYALTGDKDTALSALPSSFALEYFPNAVGGDYDSYVKRLSIYLQALCSINRLDGRVKDLAGLIEKAAVNGNFGSTHDNEEALVALAEAYSGGKGGEVDAGLYIGGNLISDLKTGQQVFEDPSASGKTVTVRNRSDSPLYFNIYIEGVPAAGSAEPVSRGLEIKREYFDVNGKPLNLTSVMQGELAVATITLKTSGKLDNLVVVDLLPAGFEIENPRLNSRGQLEWQPPYNWQDAYEDIRDDRIMLFTGPVDGVFQYSYTVRAVTSGEFIIPQIYAEAMYAPEIKAVGQKQGRLDVTRIGK